MQAALLSLGTVPSKERIQKYLSGQWHQRSEDLEHGFSCECDECSRRQVLGLRRIRRSRSSARQESEPVRTGSRRRRTKHENARRGEGKIGRVAQLRPGRITFDTVLIEEGRRLELNRQGQCNPEDVASQFNASNAECSWNSDEHSAHSNALYRQTKTERRAWQEDQAQARKRTEQYMDGFYDRNPAAKANGWLAMSHHRDGGVDGRARRDAVDRAAAGLIKVQQRQLLGLVPKFKAKKRSMDSSKRESRPRQ
ncbi:serine/threonine-protein phosphatase [Pseudozyma hubeiensis SY62]|uniref:Serine/threonine-protein phosphatase n=1 Tax=Pseudozyma hubeiensis (strain SY62) TaxID=1305764 RepID=R9P0P3_PSEHS|nr:serine/threonine-protein phosphatase [Pseudozyma hubeiensis SY62]GAC94632.1 serine/threonine-protein phosphatase [Pseudozyma hubeiensis SY62]